MKTFKRKILHHHFVLQDDTAMGGILPLLNHGLGHASSSSISVLSEGDSDVREACDIPSSADREAVEGVKLFR